MPALPIDSLSVMARHYIAATCLQRFCRRHAIHHPALCLFMDQRCKVAQLGRDDFAAWEQGIASLPITRMGDPWPEDVCQANPRQLLAPLMALLQHVLETSACTWYDDDLPASRRQLDAVLRLCGQQDVAVPAFDGYRQHDAPLRDSWGPPLKADELSAWQARISPVPAHH